MWKALRILLDHTLPEVLCKALSVLRAREDATTLPLVDDQVTTAHRTALAGGVVGATMNTPEEAVRTLLASEDWMRSCALFAIGTLQLRELAPDLDRALAGTNPLERDAARVAKTHLAPAADEPDRPTDEADRWMGGAVGVG